MRVPLLNLNRQTAAIRPQLDAAIARVLDHGQFILGPEVAELEREIATRCGVAHAIACASGSDALLLPLMALGIGPGHKVVTTPFTFFATASAITRLGATPVFLDIDPETFNLDPAALDHFLSGVSAPDIKSVKAILPVHLFGQCAEMEAINRTAARYNIPVIEDAAQALGSQYNGVPAGALAWCAAFSFFPTKNLGAFGDGGIVTTSDPALAGRLKTLRVHGSATKYHHQEVGINSRLDSIQAAVLLVKLRHLDEWTEGRRANAAAYREQFAGKLPAWGGVPVDHPRNKHVYNQFTIRVPDRDRLRARLAESGVGSEVYYPVPLHLQECFAYLGYQPGDLPQSEAAAHEVLSLPIEPGLSYEDIGTVVDALRHALSPGH